MVAEFAGETRPVVQGDAQLAEAGLGEVGALGTRALRRVALCLGLGLALHAAAHGLGLLRRGGGHLAELTGGLCGGHGGLILGGLAGGVLGGGHLLRGGGRLAGRRGGGLGRCLAESVGQAFERLCRLVHGLGSRLLSALCLAGRSGLATCRLTGCGLASLRSALGLAGGLPLPLLSFLALGRLTLGRLSLALGHLPRGFDELAGGLRGLLLGLAEVPCGLLRGLGFLTETPLLGALLHLLRGLGQVGGALGEGLLLSGGLAKGVALCEFLHFLSEGLLPFG